MRAACLTCGAQKGVAPLLWNRRTINLCNGCVDKHRNPTWTGWIDGVIRRKLGIVEDVDAVTRGKHHAHPQPTEAAAATAVWPRTGTQRRAVLEAILWSSGLTDPEIAERTGIYLYSAAPRRVELLHAGWVEDSGERRDSGHGGSAIVWRATEKARRKAE